MKKITMIFCTFLILLSSPRCTLSFYHQEDSGIPSHNFLLFFNTSDQMTNGILNPVNANFPLLNRQTFVDQFTQLPIDQVYDETTTTTETTNPSPNYNTTLDVANDVTGYWTTSRTTLQKWFEYYQTTTELKNNYTDSRKCAHIISGRADQLTEKQGIWVACQDPELLLVGCLLGDCYPEISFKPNGQLPISRTVKIHLALSGLATVRLTVEASGSPQRPSCFDFSFRKDPFTPCEFVKVENTGEMQWKQVKTMFNGYDNIDFTSFTVKLFSRFKSDVALVDKIEGTEDLLCGDDDTICATTPTGATRSTTTTIPPPTTIKLTTKCSASTGAVKILRAVDDTYTTTLDSIQDAVANKSSWEIPLENPKKLEYYDDSDSLIAHQDNTSTCANLLSSSMGDLMNVTGIWSNCQFQNSDRSLSLPKTLRYTSHPFITYFAPKGHFVYSITVAPFLKDMAILTLHVGNECFDYSIKRDTFSPCTFIKMPNTWTQTYWPIGSKPENHKLASFRLQLISRFAGDVVLIDKVKVVYKKCYDDDCSLESTTAGPTSSTVQTTSPTTARYDCNYETSAPTSSNEPTSTTAVPTSVRPSTTMSSTKISPTTTTLNPTTPEDTSSSSWFYTMPTMFPLILLSGFAFLNWKI